MYKARAIRDFSFEKTQKLYKKGDNVEGLTKEDIDYLLGNNPLKRQVIDSVEEIVEKAVEEKKVEKAVKKTKKK